MRLSAIGIAEVQSTISSSVSSRCCAAINKAAEARNPCRARMSPTISLARSFWGDKAPVSGITSAAGCKFAGVAAVMVVILRACSATARWAAKSGAVGKCPILLMSK